VVEVVEELLNTQKENIDEIREDENG